MNSNQIKEIKLNPKDIYKISPNLILHITLKNGYVITLDDSIPSQKISKLFNNKKIEKYAQSKNRNNNKSINFPVNNSYTKDNINGKSLEINDSYIFSKNIFNREILNKSNNYSNNFFYPSNPNNSINNQNEIEKKESAILNNNEIKNNFKSHNQSISDLVTEKFKQRFHSNSKNNKNSRLIKTTINSEININIKGDETKKKDKNSLLKEFDELLLNFNDIKKGLINNNINNNSKKKYKYYKKINSKKKEKMLLEDLSGISANTKAIKYIRRNEQKKSTTIVTELSRKNMGTNINNNSRFSFLKERALKRNKSNNFCLLKNNKIINDIISPPNNLNRKILLMKNK